MNDSTRINELRKEIEALCDNCDRPNKEETGNIILSAMVFGFGEGLKAPSADRPQGEWIQKPHKVYLPRDCEPLFEETYNEADHSIIEYWWHCNHCDYEADSLSKPTFKFCPDCGARMKGADDE